MLLFETDRFTEKAHAFSIERQLATLRENPVSVRFDPIVPYLKHRIDKFRLVAKRITVDDTDVLILLDIFQRKDSSYDAFLDDQRRFGRDHLEPLINDVQLSLAVSEYRTQAARAAAKPPLPDGLRPWLEFPGWHANSGDRTVFESGEWVAAMGTREVSDRWQTYHELAINACSGEGIADPATPNVLVLQKDGYGIAFSRLPMLDGPDDLREVVFLALPYKCSAISDEERVALIGQALPAALRGDIVDADALRSHARRSYPDFVLADPDVWHAIERDEEANLALSTEEEELLRALSSGSHGRRLPAFINGRAGSGKSTMLQYLFADYCQRTKRSGVVGHPLYVTYSRRLLESARDNVVRLLASHQRFQSESSQVTAVDVGGYFRDFQSLLLSLLPPERRGKFDPRLKISFHRFRELFLGTLPKDRSKKARVDWRSHAFQAGRKPQHSPEVAWYAIRSLIKGYLPGQLLTPEDYLEIPRRDRVLDFDLFKDVYEHVWGRWYSGLATHGLWDDQDLVRDVLEYGDLASTEFAAIFCDEAQDFTRLELRFIMKLSSLTRYDLGFERPPCLPFAFAGDPFQTLNPTGFRWSSLQAAFWDEILTAVDPYGRTGTDFQVEDLEINYRSAGPIVNLANVIQLWRRVLFAHDELRPQEGWAQDEMAQPQLYVIGQNASHSELASALSKAVILVSCDEDGEASFVRGDPLLREIFQGQEDSDIARRVMSPSAAKGLEFSRVVLYKFGEGCPQENWDKARGEGPTIQLEYYFNNLYVSASRARRRLFVVDSVEGCKRVWAHALGSDAFERFLARVSDREVWQGRLQLLREGHAGGALEMAESVATTADEFRAKGEFREDPGLLLRASSCYMEIGDVQSASRCRALALKLDEDYSAAARLYEQLEDWAEAHECYWNAADWQRVTNLADTHPAARGSITELQQRLARAALGKTSAASVSELSGVLLEAAQRKAIDITQAAWREVCGRLATATRAVPASVLDAHDWSTAASVLQLMGNMGMPAEMFDAAASAFYHANNAHAAAECWERSGKTPREYYLAKIEVDGFPKAIPLLEHLPESVADPMLLEQWQEQGAPSERAWLRAVAPALHRQRQLVTAAECYFQIGDVARAKDVLHELVRQGDPIPATIVDSLLDYELSTQRWEDAARTARTLVDSAEADGSMREEWRARVLQRIGASSLTPKDISASALDDTFRPLIRKVDSSGWSRYLSVKAYGAALERVGDLTAASRIYERHARGTAPVDDALRTYCQERFLSCLVKRAGSAQTKDESLERQIERASLRWGFDDPRSLPALPPQSGDVVIQSLRGRRDIQVETPMPGVKRIVLQPYEIKILQEQKVVTVEALAATDRLVIDAATGETTGTMPIQRDVEDGAVNIRLQAPAAMSLALRIIPSSAPKVEIRVGDRGISLAFE